MGKRWGFAADAGAGPLGMLAGQWLRQRISAALFKRCFFIGLAALGGHLLING